MTSNGKTASYEHLTKGEFWELYWDNLKLPCTVDPDFAFDRCLCRAFLKHVPRGEGRRLIEIGCAPGRWMIFFHQTFGYQVDGIELLPCACEKTRSNLAMNRVPGRVFQADFTTWNLSPASYDAVLSLGFIEHFNPVEPVLAKHVELLKPSGLLILGVPNFRGLNYFLEWYLDRATLRAHNSSVASLRFFKGLSNKFPLKPVWFGHIGGFEPTLFTVASVPNSAGILAKAGHAVRYRIRNRIARLRTLRNRWERADSLNHPWLSSYTLGLFERV